MKVTYSEAGFGINSFDHKVGRAYSYSYLGTSELSHIYSSSVDEEFRGHGLGDKFHKERIEFFKNEGCTSALTCVVRKDNEAEIAILKKNGWEFLREFKGFDGQALYFCFKQIGD